MIKEGVIIGGRYEIMERIGTGGMADVYKATDRVLRRYVAIKVLKREFREDETFVVKFRSEAQAAAGLTHANIVNIYDVAEDRGLYYIVMELVEGITLKEYIQKKGKLAPKEVIGIILQVCAGIDAAHSNSIIHRDIKPQNIMISKEGKVKVTDFGIAKATSSNTISTNVMGSVHYTSPEQARGGFSDAKSDIYSLGITMYEMITGQLPFDGESTVTIALKHLQEDMILPSEFVPDMPYSLEQIILKCTQKSPDRRYMNVTMLARDLKRSIQEPDGRFVKIAPLVNVSDTVMITPEELEQLKGASKYEMDYDDYDDYDEYYGSSRYGERRSGRTEDKEIEPRMTKLMKILSIVAASIFLLSVGGVLIYSLARGGIGAIKGSSEVGIVPNLVGMKEEKARQACIKAQVEIEIIEEESLDYDAGYVFKQYPNKGAKLPEGATVKIYVSTGLKELEMPDLVGKSEDAAIKELKHIGFKEEKIIVKEINDDEIPAGDVVKTNPEAGSRGTSRTKITIWISKGESKAIMPDLYGMTIEEAQQALEEAGLEGEYILVGTTSSSEIGRFLELDPSQGFQVGDELDKGTVVKYKAGGIEIPDASTMVGKNYMDIMKQLEKHGLKIKLEYTASTSYKKDMVVKVKEAGEVVKADSTVTITVSTGPGPSEGDTE